MTRRHFLTGLGASTLVAGCEMDDVARLVDDVRVDVRLGVLANVEIGWKTSTAAFKKALRYFQQQGVDAVVIAGGATLNGYADQLQVLRVAWCEVFGRNAKIPLVLEEGRHEIKGFAFNVRARRPAQKDEVLTFHGHGKRELTNDFWFYDESTQAVHAGTLSGVTVLAGYEYDKRISDGKMNLKAEQGLLVSVYSSQIEIRRLDFTQAKPVESRGVRRGTIYAEDVAPALVLDRATLRTTVESATPEFWADTQLKPIYGFEGSRRILTVKWPHILKRYCGARAARYEVGVHARNEKDGSLRPAFARRYVLPKGFHLSESRDLEPVSSVLDGAKLDEFLKIHPQLTLSVTPVSSRGGRGKALLLPLALTER